MSFVIWLRKMIQSILFKHKGCQSEVTLCGQDTKLSVVEKLGPADSLGGYFGKRKVPLIFVYSEYEFHFEPSGKLIMVYQDSSDGLVTTCVRFDKNTI
uniref:hypothetical protein n=1 Tax=Thaumasiovibrio subtropicus TaxID=1891207 RepID=UPI000B352013|nr:hypothetical protein [Thaumasiovibrio subtropicus]